jgi:hypothetical protein
MIFYNEKKRGKNSTHGKKAATTNITMMNGVAERDSGNA